MYAYLLTMLLLSHETFRRLKHAIRPDQQYLAVRVNMSRRQGNNTHVAKKPIPAKEPEHSIRKGANNKCGSSQPHALRQRVPSGRQAILTTPASAVQSLHYSIGMREGTLSWPHSICTAHVRTGQTGVVQGCGCPCSWLWVSWLCPIAPGRAPGIEDT